MDLTIKKLPVRADYIQNKAIDPRLPQPNFRLAVISPSYSGKTNMILSLIKEKRFYWNYFKVFIFSKSIRDDSIFDNISIKEKYIADHISVKKIQKILQHQSYLRQKYEEEGKLEKLPRLLFILDDMAGDSKLSNRASIITTLLYRGRHSNLSLILVSQAYKALAKSIRTNFSDLIFYGVENQAELKSIAEENSGGITTKKFEKLFNYATKDKFNFLYVARKYKGRLRFRKNFDSSIWIEGNEVKEEPLILPYPKPPKRQIKIRPSKINYKPIPPKKHKKKKYSVVEDCFENVKEETSEDETSESEYDEY